MNQTKVSNGCRKKVEKNSSRSASADKKKRKLSSISTTPNAVFNPKPAVVDTSLAIRKKSQLTVPIKKQTLLCFPISFHSQEHLTSLDRAGCWSFKECENQIKMNLIKLRRLNLLNMKCLLKRSDELDEKLIQDLAANHLQTARNFNHDNIRYFYDIGFNEYVRIRQEYLPIESLEERGCKSKFLVSFSLPKVCKHVEKFVHVDTNSNTSRPRRTVRSTYRTRPKINSETNKNKEIIIPCSNTVVDCSEFCVKHIHMDEKQTLFKQCQYSMPPKDNTDGPYSRVGKCDELLLLTKPKSIYCDEHEMWDNFSTNPPNRKRISDMTGSSVLDVYNFVSERSGSKMTPSQDENNPAKSSYDSDGNTDEAS